MDLAYLINYWEQLFFVFDDWKVSFNTYIPMRKGFMYMTEIIDVYSRKIVRWGISNTISAQWCKMFSKKQLLYMVSRRLLTVIRVASIPVHCGRNILNNKASIYRWMARAEHWIKFRSSDSGSHWKTIISILIPSMMVLNSMEEFKTIID